MSENPRHLRILEMIQAAERELGSAADLLERNHPDWDALDDVLADLKYVSLKFRGRMPP